MIITLTLFQCLHGGECVDDVDGFECQCQPGYSGDHCQCSEPEADSEYEEAVCVDVNNTLSWTIPPDYLPDYTDLGDMETTTQGEEVIHVADVEVTVGYDDVTQVKGQVEGIEPTPSIPMGSTEFMGKYKYLLRINSITIYIEWSFDASISMSLFVLSYCLS